MVSLAILSKIDKKLNLLELSFFAKIWHFAHGRAYNGQKFKFRQNVKIFKMPCQFIKIDKKLISLELSILAKIWHFPHG